MQTDENGYLKVNGESFKNSISSAKFDDSKLTKTQDVKDFLQAIHDKPLRVETIVNQNQINLLDVYKMLYFFFAMTGFFITMTIMALAKNGPEKWIAMLAVILVSSFCVIAQIKVTNDQIQWGRRNG